MNRTEIEWTDFTWNPQTGCTKRCSYCYAMRMANRLRGRFGYPSDDPFKPTFHPNRLSEPNEVSMKHMSKNKALKKGRAMIFVCSMGDMADAKYDDFEKIIDVMGESNHVYQLLTKRPNELKPKIEIYKRRRGNLPDNLWLGVSINKNTDNKRIEELLKLSDKNRFVSIEPIMENINLEQYSELDWIIVGAETGNRKGKVVPKKEWIDELVRQSETMEIPLFLKDNLYDIYGCCSLIQTFPNFEEEQG